MTAQPRSSRAPRLSFVVIGYEEGAKLQLCLESCRRAARKISGGVEILYVDSGSQDGSWETARRRSDVSCLRIDPRRRNAARARNRGVRRAKGRFVQFLDGDMTVDSDWPLRAVRELEEHPDWDAVAGRLEETRLRATVWNRAFGLDWSTETGPTDSLGGASLWRRSSWAQVGEFDEKLRVGEDPEHSLRAVRLGFSLRRLSISMATHDLDLRSFSEYWRRGLGVGESLANVAWRHPRPRILAKAFRPIRDLAMGVVGLSLTPVFGGVFLSILAVAVVGVFLRKVLSHRGRGHSVLDALVHAAHLYGVKLPVAWGVLRRGARLMIFGESSWIAVRFSSLTSLRKSPRSRQRSFTKRSER